MLNSNITDTIEIKEIASTSHKPSIRIGHLSQNIEFNSVPNMLNQNNDFIEIENVIIDTTHMPTTSINNLSQISIPNSQRISLHQETSLSSINENIVNKSFKDDLCKWVLECNVPHTTVNKLLHAMKQQSIINTNELPWDSRTLLATRTKISSNIRVVDPGNYYHLGLKSGIIRHATTNLSEIKIMIGIDGLHIAKSSNSQLWPILAYIKNKTNIVFPVGIYHGYAKPNDSNDFLDDFITEAKDLIANGILLNNCIKKVLFIGFICDSPAKTFILKLKGHSGFSSCTRCTQVGEYYKNRVCYPYCNFSPIRTHITYLNKTYEEHHVGNALSKLTELSGLDVVKMFPIDYMHLVALGVVKKLILLWLHTGPVHTRIPGRLINILSSSLLNIKLHIPIDFPRKTREIQEFGRYKASELRFFVVYIGPIVLKHILIEDCYTNFMALHVAMLILLSPDYDSYLNYANELLQYFVKTFETIYGRQHISHNVHGLLHLTDDYQLYGPLDNCSAFPFENFMKELKSKVRKHEKPLEQLINRYSEIYKLPKSPSVLKE